MRTRWMVTIVALTAFAAGAAAAISIRRYKNGIYYTMVDEEEKVEFYDQAQKARFISLRGVACIPPEFGRLVTITGSSDDVVFWFEDDGGVVRNIPVEGRRLLMVRREGKLSR